MDIVCSCMSWNAGGRRITRIHKITQHFASHIQTESIFFSLLALFLPLYSAVLFYTVWLNDDCVDIN